MPPKGKRVGRKRKQSMKRKKGGSKDVFRKIHCPNCTESFCTESDLKRHALKNCKVINIVTITAKKEKKFSCDICNKKFKFKHSHDNHMENEHCDAPNSVDCELCPVRCPNKSILRAHINNTHERDTYVCRHCNKHFARRAHVLRHWAQKGCDGQKVSSYPCEICTATFTRKDNLMVHLRDQHIRTNAFLCKHCAYLTKNFSKLIRHYMLQHGPNPMQLECDKCGKVTKSRPAMTKHLEIHGDKKYSCEVCRYSTHTVEVMRRHVLTHVADKPYKCTVCHRSYIQRMQLERHLEKHTGIVCPDCSMKFKCKIELAVHRLDHMVVKKLFCPYKECSNAKEELSDMESFRAHIKWHQGAAFQCEVCNKVFTSELRMRRHVSTHALDRPRRCMYCVSARAYVRGEQLLKHVRKVHPNVFRNHLVHVRNVLGVATELERVSKSELEAVLNMMDAEAERIMQGCGGALGAGVEGGVLYGGMQEVLDEDVSRINEQQTEKSDNPVMGEEEFAANMNKLLSQLVDSETLQCFGWPNEDVDVVLEKVLEQCDTKPADRALWTRVQRLRENAKHLFLYVVEDKTIVRMLNKHTIDQVVTHILSQVTDDADNEHVETKPIPFHEL